MLGNGRGKGRMLASAQLRAHHEWHVLFYSSGEQTIASKLEEAGLRSFAGQAVRVIELQADMGKGLGAFEDVHEFTGSAELARHLHDATNQKAGRNVQCGYAGDAFLSGLAADFDGCMTFVRDVYVRFKRECISTDADGQVQRAGGRFAAVAAAGELATRLGITGWSEGDALEAARTTYRRWVQHRGGTGKAEITAAFSQVRLFLEQHGEARFAAAWAPERLKTHVSADGRDIETVKTDRPTINRAGFRKAGDDGWTYYVLPEVWRREVCKGMDAQTVARAMVERGWMLKATKQISRVERIPGEGNTTVYVITPAFQSATGTIGTTGTR
jgi:putative DNA primase/helicase